MLLAGKLGEICVFMLLSVLRVNLPLKLDTTRRHLLQMFVESVRRKLRPNRPNLSYWLRQITDSYGSFPHGFVRIMPFEF